MAHACRAIFEYSYFNCYFNIKRALFKLESPCKRHSIFFDLFFFRGDHMTHVTIVGLKVETAVGFSFRPMGFSFSTDLCPKVGFQFVIHMLTCMDSKHACRNESF